MTDFIGSTGHRVTIDCEDDTYVTYYQAGGGWQCRMPTAQFHEIYKPAPAPAWRRGTVTAEWLGYDPEVRVACWSDDSLWNGFGMPYFEREQVEQLVSAQADMLAWRGNDVVATLEGSDEPEVYSPVTLPNGIVVWPIGTGSWCWDRVAYDDR